MDDLLKTYVWELKNRNYSRNTIKAYQHSVQKFIEYSQTNTEQPEKRIGMFLDSYSDSFEQKRIAYNAIKQFYRLVIKKECPYILDKIKKQKRLPSLLNNEEIHKLLAQIKNRKHFLMIALLYASGLRVSEVVNLKVKDFDLHELSLHIRNSKNHKDRITIFSDKVLQELEALIINRDPKQHLFLANGKNKYAIRTVQLIFSKALSKTGINKKATCHSLRHSFATHLVENGVDIKTIQSLLGHSSVKTTMVYIHLADPISRRIKSPM